MLMSFPTLLASQSIIKSALSGLRIRINKRVLCTHVLRPIHTYCVIGWSNQYAYLLEFVLKEYSGVRTVYDIP